MCELKTLSLFILEEIITHIETKTANLFFEDSVLHIVFKQDAAVDLEDVVENKEARLALQQGKKALVLGDIREVWQLSKEAQNYLASEEVTNLNIAMAILINSLTTVLTANFFIRFKKPKTPTKMFSSKKEALEWLLAFKK